MLGPPAGRPGNLDLPEAGAEVGDVGDRAGVHQRIVGERRRRAHPQRIGVANLAVADARRRDLADLDEERRRTRRRASTDRRHRGSGPRRRSRSPRAAWNDATIEKMTSPSCTARTWRAENEPPSRSRSTWRITGRSTRPGPEEVAVQRVRQPLGRHRRARGPQRLRRDLAAVQRHARSRARLVLAAEEVAVEDLEVEQRRQVRRHGTQPLGEREGQVGVGDDARRRGDDPRDRVDRGHRRHDHPEHHEVGERRGLEVGRRQVLELGAHGRAGRRPG